MSFLDGNTGEGSAQNSNERKLSETRAPAAPALVASSRPTEAPSPTTVIKTKFSDIRKDHVNTLNPKTKALSSISKVSMEAFPKQADVDALLARELTEMSVEERERVYEDLHGVASVPLETPEKVSQAMESVQAAIPGMEAELKEALLEALAQDPNILKDRKFVLKFLRAARYEIDECAHRVAVYFETKKRLFGANKLAKHITIEQDFDKEDLRCLNSGIIQLLPHTDQTGRGILCWNMMLEDSYSKISRQRSQFYVYEIGSQPEGVQRNGMIVISSNVGALKQSMERVQNGFRNPAVVAMNQVRCAAFHFCLSDTSEESKSIASAMQKLVGRDTRVRFRTHMGEIANVKRGLASFGIPAHEVYPIEDDGTVRLDQHHAWIAQRRSIEQTMANTSITSPAPQGGFDPVAVSNDETNGETTSSNGQSSKSSDDAEGAPSTDGEIIATPPGDWDVVCGRGRTIQELKGNIRFRGIIRAFFDRYEALPSPEEKTFLAIEIVQNIREKGGKFIKQAKDNIRWEEVDSKVARNKVVSAFHSYRRSNKKALTLPPHPATSQSAPTVSFRPTPGAFFPAARNILPPLMMMSSSLSASSSAHSSNTPSPTHEQQFGS